MFADHSQPALAPPRARRRVTAYFRSLGYRDAGQLTRLADAFAAGADAAETPETALAELRQVVAGVFRTGLGVTDLSDERAEAVGRVAFLMLGGAERWPDLFLAGGEVVADFAGQLAVAAPLAVPTETPGAMPEQSLSPITKEWARTLGLEPKGRPA